MFHIAVCDDEQISAERLAFSLREIFAAKGVDAGVSLFLSGDELLSAAPDPDLVFLDIDMPGMDGITAGKILHGRNHRCEIVMVSAMEHRVKEGYLVGARRFVSKPVDPAELNEAVDAVLKKAPGEDLIRLFLDNRPYEIPQSKIDYAEAYNGYTVFHVGDMLFRREENLKHFDAVLDQRMFVRISRKHIINLGRVSAGNTMDEFRIREDCMKVARRQKDAVRQKMIEYDLLYGGK